MKTKLQFIAIALLLAVSTLVSCNKSDDSIQELKFSVNEPEVHTDGTEYSFGITSGGGVYKAEICPLNSYDKYATATVSGKTVTVKLVSERTKLQVTDQYGQQKDLIIRTTNSSLQAISFDIAMGYGFQNRGKFEWGSGEGYSILKSINPENAELMIKENGEYVANSLCPGSTVFVVKDSRGTVNFVRVTSFMGWNLENDNLSVDVESGFQYTFILKWGEGKVRVSDCSAELKNPWLLIQDENEFQRNKVLQVCANEGSTGKFFVELTDAANKKAIITLNAQIKTKNN
jgi:hypothetical protein